MSRYRTGGGPDAHRAGLGPHAPVAQRADDDGAGVGVHLHLIPRVLRADRPGINAGIKTRTVRHRHTHAKCLRAPRPDTSESLTLHESDGHSLWRRRQYIQKRLQELIGLDSDRAPHSRRGHHAQRGQLQGEVW